jgi:hypothetical protein
MGVPVRPILWILLALLGPAVSASAQSEAPVGVRATGMGGAFTAVADDSSAAFWNPAGFATGSFFSLVVDGNVLDRRSGLFIGMGVPPLGLSYYRTAIAAVKNGRNTLVAQHAGVTLVQSIGGRLAVGSTLKLVHGVVSVPAGSDTVSGNAFDADLGVMATGSFGQLGLSVRNLLEPEFKTGDGAVRLERRVRGGISIHAGQATTVAADLDFTTATTPRGEWRDAAVGVETHPVRNAWLRGGVHWNTAGNSGPGAAPIGSFGGSYTVYGSVTADAQVSFGSRDGDRGWGAGLRFAF